MNFMQILEKHANREINGQESIVIKVVKILDAMKECYCNKNQLLNFSRWLNSITEIPEKIETDESLIDYYLTHILCREKVSCWISPNNQLPYENNKIIFKLKDNNIKLGVFLKKDQFERIDMFCDGSYYNVKEVEGWYYLPSV